LYKKMNVLKNKNILLCVTGSIAAYKACELLRLLRKEKANVQVMMSKTAEEFVGKASFAALSNNEVLTNLFPEKPKGGLEHVNLAFELDAIIIAPATANILCKAATGVADEIVSTALSICDVPKIFAPAMNFNMWSNKPTIDAVKTLESRNYVIIEPEEGELASLHRGKGRLADLSKIVNGIKKMFNFDLILENKNILITAGPTQEPIDPVRFLSNRSSGKMGYALAKASKNLGGKVTLISGPVSLNKLSGINHLDIRTAEEMAKQVSNQIKKTKYDIIIMAAAVADYKPKEFNKNKIKKNNNLLDLELMKTQDILKNIISQEKGLKIGFALETDNGEENAKKKLVSKSLDYIVLNFANKKGEGFESETNHIYVYSKNGQMKEFEKDTKYRLSEKLLQHIISNEQ
tara:strand:- start:1051 stop:2265 length:1215 start_codon:yes stop_codon:yes gene_type:complete